MGNSIQMQTPASKEKDACKKPQSVKFQIQIEAKKTGKNNKLTVEETTYFRGFPRVFLIFVNWNTHQTQKLSESTPDTAALPLVSWMKELCCHFNCTQWLWYHRQGHTTFFFRSFRSIFPQFCSVVTGLLCRGEGELSHPSAEAALPYMKDESQTVSEFSEKPTGLASCPSSKLYFSIFKWWLFIDFKDVWLRSSGPDTGEIPSSWEVRQNSFHGNSCGDNQHSLELPPLLSWEVEGCHLSGHRWNCGLLNHGLGCKRSSQATDMNLASSFAKRLGLTPGEVQSCALHRDWVTASSTQCIL